MEGDPIALAGIGRNEDGSLSGHHIEWIAFESRNFRDLLADWSERVSTRDAGAFIRSVGLSGALSQDDLIEMISGQKAPSRELTNYLCAVVPSDLCSWLVLRNRGYSAARTASEHVSLPAESLAAARLQRIASIAIPTPAPTGNDDSTGTFLEFVSEKVDEIARRLSRTADSVESMANLARALGLSVEEFKGENEVKSHIAEKAKDLARLLALEGDDFDQCTELAELAWSGVSAGRSDHAFPRIMKFLRHTQGLYQKDFAATLGWNQNLIRGVERGIAWPANDFVGRVSEALNLADNERAILERTAAEYSAALSADIGRHLEPVVAHFSKYGLTAEAMLHAATRQPSLFYQKPETLIANIEGVYSHFKDDGLVLKDYLQVATRRPTLFTQKPETLIANVEGVYSRFKDDGLLLKDYLQAATKQPALFYQKPETLIEHINIIIGLYKKGRVTFSKASYDRSIDRPLRPLVEFLTRNPILMGLRMELSASTFRAT
jgi:transcriptional regulator with XRE-family HTH domain